MQPTWCESLLAVAAFVAGASIDSRRFCRECNAGLLGGSWEAPGRCAVPVQSHVGEAFLLFFIYFRYYFYFPPMLGFAPVFNMMLGQLH